MNFKEASQILTQRSVEAHKDDDEATRVFYAQIAKDDLFMSRLALGFGIFASVLVLCTLSYVAYKLIVR